MRWTSCTQTSIQQVNHPFLRKMHRCQAFEFLDHLGRMSTSQCSALRKKLSIRLEVDRQCSSFPENTMSIPACFSSAEGPQRSSCDKLRDCQGNIFHWFSKWASSRARCDTDRFASLKYHRSDTRVPPQLGQVQARSRAAVRPRSHLLGGNVLGPRALGSHHHQSLLLLLRRPDKVNHRKDDVLNDVRLARAALA